MIRRSGMAVIALVLGVTSVQAKVLGTFGVTYRISERDALAEIEERARQVDWSKVLDKPSLQVRTGARSMAIRILPSSRPITFISRPGRS